MKSTLQAELRTAYRSLKQHRLRSILSMLGVIFGVMSFLSMLSVGERSKRETLAQIEQLGLDNIILRLPAMTDNQGIRAQEQQAASIDEKDIHLIRLLIPEIEIVAPTFHLQATLHGTIEDFIPEVMATTRDYLLACGLSVEKGRFITDLDVNGKKAICVLGHELSRLLGAKGRVGEFIKIDNELFKIVGILGPRKIYAGRSSLIPVKDTNRLIFIPLSTSAALISGEQKEGYSEVLIKLNNRHALSQATLIIKSVLAHNHRNSKNYQIVVPSELVARYKQARRNYNIFLGIIAAISLMVGGVGIMNIMLASVSERTREIGIRRAVGANKWHIKRQFLFESLLISLIGGIVGASFGMLIVYAISTFAGWKTYLNIWIILISLGLAMLVGVFAGIYPATKASSMAPVDALRHE